MGFFKNIYYFFEDRWYILLDKLNNYLPVYKVIDPVDKVVPSFILFLLLLLFILVLLGYLAQFTSPYDVTFTTLDSSTSETLSGVRVFGSVQGEIFEKTTLTDGTALVSVMGKSVNTYQLLGRMLFSSPIESFTAVVSAEKSGYEKVTKQEVTIESKAASLALKKIAVIVNPNSTIVELVDEDSGETIVDSTNTAYIKFKCANKTILEKKVLDNDDGARDGSFTLNETDCHFVVAEATSPGYEDESGREIDLPISKDSHTIELKKIDVETKGYARVRVYEKGTASLADPKEIPGVLIKFLSSSGTVIDQGSTDSSGTLRKNLDAGTYTLTASSPDGNYYSIGSDANKKITVTVGSQTDSILEMEPMNVSDRRFVKIKVIDSVDTNVAISGAIVFAQKLIKDSNNVIYAVAGAWNCTNNCFTDANGILSVLALSSRDDSNVLLAIYKEGYLFKAIKPQLFKTASEIETVYLTKADTNTSGTADIDVKSSISKKPITGAKAFLYMNSIELGIKRICLLQDGKLTNNVGRATYFGLPTANYFAKATLGSIVSRDSNIKSIDVGQRQNLLVELDVNVSYIEIKLIDGSTGASVANQGGASVKLYKASSDFSSIDETTLETLSYSSLLGAHQSVGYEDSSNLLIKINLAEYASNFVELKGGLSPGANRINVRMYPLSVIDKNVKVFFNGLYKSNSDLIRGNKATFLALDNTEYYSRIDIVITKPLPYTELLAMLRVNDALQINKTASIENIGFKTPLYFVQNGLYSCLTSEKTPINDDNFFIQTAPSCNKTDANLGLQAGIKWQGVLPSGTLPVGTYYFAPTIKFTPSAKDGDSLELNYFAKEKHATISSEDKGKMVFRIGSAICDPQTDSTCSKLFFNVKINNSSAKTDQYNYDSANKLFSKPSELVQVLSEMQNVLEVSVFNNTKGPLSDVKLTAYSSLTKANSITSGSGTIKFDEPTGSTSKVLTDPTLLSVGSFEQSTPVSAAFFPIKANASNYIVLKAEIGGETYLLYIDTKAPGRKLILSGARFMAGVADQNFDGEIFVSSGRIPAELANVLLTVKKNCTGDGTKIVPVLTGNYFNAIISGIYAYGKDCIIVDAQPTNIIYSSLHETLYAGSGGILDPTLACIDVSFPDAEDDLSEISLDWGRRTDLRIVNRCAASVDVVAESGLVIENKNPSEPCSPLLTGRECTLSVKGQNKTYLQGNEPNFTDVLGLFPVLVKAKYSASNKKFALAGKLKVHLFNSSTCFAINKDEFDFLKEASPSEFKITDECQYILFGDYYIPRSTLNAIGADLTTAAPKYDFIDFNYAFKATGGGFDTTYVQRPMKSAIYFNEQAKNVTSSVDGNYRKYTNFSFKLNDFNGTSERLFFKWIDYSKDSNSKYGARIDGNVLIKYRNGTTTSIIPKISFDLNNPATCVCNGIKSDSNFCGNASGEHCMTGIERAEVLECGLNCNLSYGLAYTNFPQGNVSEIDFNVLGNLDNNVLEINARTWVDYTELVPVITPNNDIDSILFGEDSFRIYPMEGVTYLLKSFNGVNVDAEYAKKQRYCVEHKSNTAWIDANKVVWTTTQFMNWSSALEFCSQSAFLGTADGLARTDQLSEGMISEINSTPLSWIPGDGNYGFWTGKECTTNSCGVWLKEGSALSLESTSLLGDIEHYAPLCDANIQNFSVTNAECNAMNIVCDSANNCVLKGQNEFDSFIDSRYLTKRNPIIDFNINNVKSGSSTLSSGSVVIWIEGGFLKARYLGDNYTGYDDQTIELFMNDASAAGIQYSIVNIVDYVNKNRAKNS